MTPTIVFADAVTAFTNATGGISFTIGVAFDTAAVVLPVTAHDNEYNDYEPLQFCGTKQYRQLVGTLYVRLSDGSVVAAPEGIGVTALITAFKKG